MYFERVVTFHQHIPAPITDADNEELDFEIVWRLPWAEDLQNSLLRILVLDGRALRTFVPGDHVLHRFSPLLSFVTIRAVDGHIAGCVFYRICGGSCKWSTRLCRRNRRPGCRRMSAKATCRSRPACAEDVSGRIVGKEGVGALRQRSPVNSLFAVIGP